MHQDLAILCGCGGDFCRSPKHGESLDGGSAKGGHWGLKGLVHNGPRLPAIVVFLRRNSKFPLKSGPQGPQICTIVDDCAQDAESGLEPPFVGRRESTPTPKTRFSIWTLLRTPARFTTRPLPVYSYQKNVRSKAVFGPYHSTDNYYITSRYVSELITFDVM